MGTIDAVIEFGLCLLLAYVLFKGRPYSSGSTQRSNPHKAAYASWLKTYLPFALPVAALMFGFAVHDFQLTGNNWALTSTIICVVVFIHILFRSIVGLQSHSQGG